MVRATVPPARDIRVFRNKIARWFCINGRRFPWRETGDPFRILIAEMMLRRTKADQVIPVYEELFSEYPDISALSNARGRKLQRILFPLGLRWRIPSFRMVAREIKEKYGCNFPATREDLTRLSGVGDYVAGAVLSIAFGKKEWMVDSNVVRVFKRYFGIETSREGRRDRLVIDTAKAYCRARDPRKANLAILDFSAVICTPRNPGCHICPLRRDCRYTKTEPPKRS